jgi:hypothetical protein
MNSAIGNDNSNGDDNDGRSLACYQYVLTSKAVDKELALLPKILTALVAGLILMAILLGKFSTEDGGTGAGERVSMGLAIACFAFYKWRKNSLYKSLSALSMRMTPDEILYVDQQRSRTKSD